jgi:hypothetical protein
MSQLFRVITDGVTAWTGRAIQQTIDQAAANGGGIVTVPAGTYLLDNAIRLRTGVHLMGETGAILKKIPSVSSLIPDYLGYGHYEITVAEPQKFHVGMGIHILDDLSMGFYTTVATIIGIDGERLFLDRMLNHDYGPAAKARAVSVFSLIEADQVSDVIIENLILDGNQAEETFALNGCRGAGLFIYQARRVAVRKVEIREFRGDALSFQQNIDITVEDCHLHHNTGGGIHPGSGSVRYLLQKNRIHDNGGCGIFYCLRTTHSICRSNLIENNAGIGISIGERDTDHLMANNTLRGQGGPGISFRMPTRRSGDRVCLLGNTLQGNCRREGSAEIEISPNLHWIHLLGNTLVPNGKPAISIGEGCTDIYIEGNTVSGRGQKTADVVGPHDTVRFTTPPKFPPVGPEALPPHGARHLGIENPGPPALKP